MVRHGKIELSKLEMSACTRLGISAQAVWVYWAADKSTVERLCRILDEDPLAVRRAAAPL